MKNSLIKLFLMLFCAAWMVSCEDDNKDNADTGIPYDPAKPTVLESFYPSKGKYLEKVILKGSNFGDDPSAIEVYFNSRKAAVIGTNGTDMLVLAPRLPGDVCNISVVIGGDSLTYSDTFDYETSVTVTTLAGNGTKTGFQEGTMGESIFMPRYLCVDPDNNVFICCWNETEGNQNHYVRLNEEEGIVSRVVRGIVGNAPAADMETGVISFPTQTAIGSFYTLDPRESWGPRIRQMRFITSSAGIATPTNGWKHSMAINPGDGFIYTRYYHGHIVRIHPVSYEAEVIYQTAQGDSYGLAFNPTQPNVLYMAMWSNGGNVANSICTIDVTDVENTFQRISSPVVSGGHRDGALSIAQFREPAQLYSDADGNIYVADYANHCIRRITPEGFVETVLGVPGRSGWKDGTKEEALFNGPRGVGVGQDGSVYVADYWNARIRKLSIN